MNKKDIFKKIILDFQEKKLSGIIPRKNVKLYDIPDDINKIVSLIGIRRCGKTYILYEKILKLIEEKIVNEKNIIYINFEDDRISPLELNDLNDLLESYYELYPLKKDETVYIFLDEIQNISGWEKFIRRIFDTENCRIYITGSSSKLLSKEISTSLRGRNLPFEIFPLSFKEFLTFKNYSTGSDINSDLFLYSSKSAAKIKYLLNEYLNRGGFPEVITYNDDNWRRTINDYIDLVLYKDIVERFNISNTYLMKYLIKYLLKNISSLISINKLYNDFKSFGFNISKNTVYEYISYLEDAYVIFSVPVFSNSFKEQQINPKKIYSVDIAFKKITDFSFDIGRIYENIVFLELRRNFKDIFYVKSENVKTNRTYKNKKYKNKDNYEVDFYIPENKTLINVCYDITEPDTFLREKGGLLSAMNALSVNEGYIINSEEERNIGIDGKTIRIIPLWKWLLYNNRI
ncbi:MAG: ATP-binding protein [Deltaproteobacteria bacterium]|nr:ATP-binding protein [Deltaproteobacteria bacterium]